MNPGPDKVEPSVASPATTPRLLLSIHDVGPAFAEPVARLAGRLSELVEGAHFAMLVVPDHWDAAPLSADRVFSRQLRAWSDGGVEMFLHGWCHRDDSAHRTSFARFKARQMTAGEGEFLGLAAAAAERRMRAGRDVVEQAIGRGVSGFVAPAWLYGPGAREALSAVGFAIAEDHLRVWNPRNGRILARGPVVTWASRSRARTASSLAAAALARVALRPFATVRIAVHPGDVGEVSLMGSIDRTIRHFIRYRHAARYAELLTEVTPGAEKKADRSAQRPFFMNNLRAE